MTSESNTIAFGEIPISTNVYKTQDEGGYPMTVVSKGDSASNRLVTKFGRDGERYCMVISDTVSVSSGDAVITNGENELIVNVASGAPTTEKISLGESKVCSIRSILVKTEDAEGYYQLLDRAESQSDVYTVLNKLGISMSRTEQGVLSHKTDYVFKIGEESEVIVNIGDRKYIRSEGSTLLAISRGTVYVSTKSQENNDVHVVIRIG